MRLLLSVKRSRIGMAFCAAIATAAVLGACGGGVPGDAVAQVGSANITKAAFDHWLLVANNATQASTGTKAPPVPDPPNYTNCIAAERKIPAEAGASAAQLKTVCSQNYQSLVTEVMSFLIQAVWIQGEAVDRHVSVTAKQVNKGYEAERLVSTPPLKTAAELRAFLAASGETIADLEWRTRLSLLANAISLKVQKGAAKVTSAAIAAYYKKNIASLTTPQTRSVHLVETSTSASAAKVKSLLAGGASYATVAPKYSIDPTTKTTGGAETVRPGQLTTQISAAIFAAKPGVLTGPVTTAFGYYVFTVDSVTPARVPTLKQETATIRSTIASSQEAAASSKLQADFTVKWTARTTCATGFIVSSCKNAPKTSTSSSSGASTGATAATG
jgi:parvulin-like peptidyl-prolyl isomerase